tara:strand:- start:1261 stop:1590 length:330 start_codon:yes stop_codon:yes gene_type:complete
MTRTLRVMNKQNFFDRLRAWPWLLAALICCVVVGFIAPHQLGVLVWSLSKLCLGAYLGYWIDRGIFFYARPGDFSLTRDDRHTWEIVCWCMIRRAIVIAASVLALGLGV